MPTRLALFGGKPIVKDHKNLRIDWPIIKEEDFHAVKEAFDDRDFSGRGSSRVLELEKKFSQYHGGRYATALNSGTAALHAAFVATDVQPGDEVIVPALTFVASAMSVIHNQSIPVFADIDEKTFNILPRSIEDKISKKTRAVIVVHMHGLPADMKAISEVCKKYSLKLIEDVAQAPGALFHGKKVGTFGDAAIFSLMSQKNLATCGECGILLNKTRTGKNKAEMLRIYGEIIKPNTERAYNSFTLGWNYTLNPIQAAMALSQLKRFDKTTNKIQNSARRLNKMLERFKWVSPPIEPKDVTSVFHFYRLRLHANYFNYNHSGKFRKAIQDALNAEGLNVRHYQNTPIPGQLFFQRPDLHKNLPWTLSRKKYKYHIKDYPNTLDVIQNTLILGAISSAPGYLLCPNTPDKYVQGFKKIENNIKNLLKYADKIDYHEPWKEIPVISDSFSTTYEKPNHT